MLETDKQTNKEPDQKHRSNSLTTQDMQGYDDGLTNNDRHNTYMSDNSPKNVAHEDMVVEETPDFHNEMKKRIFIQFVKDQFDLSEVG